MKTNAPKFITWVIGLVLLILGFLAIFVGELNIGIPVLGDLKTLCLLASALLLTIATMVKGL